MENNRLNNIELEDYISNLKIEFDKKALNDDEKQFFIDLFDLYKEITLDSNSCKEAEEEASKYDLKALLEKSPYNIDNLKPSSHSYQHRSFSLLMHKLSESWDKLASFRHDEMHSPRKHYFYFTYLRDTSRTYDNYIAKIYNVYNHPDMRLIALAITEKLDRKDYYPVLHEMGHYIGFRNREARKDILKDLICYEIWGRVFQLCYNRYIGIDDNRELLLHFEKVSPVGQARKQYCEVLFKCCYTLHKYLIQKLDPKQYENKDSDFRFFCKEFASSFIPYVIDTLAQISYEDPIKNEYHTELEFKVYSDIRKAIADLIEHYYSKYQFQDISHTLDCLEEPTADCFMIAMYNMGLQQYLDRVLGESYEFWFGNTKKDKRTKESFCSFISMPEHRIRILSICLAMGAQPSDIAKKTIPITKRSQYIYRARILLAIMYMHMLEMDFNNIKGIYSDINDEYERKNLLRFSQYIINPQPLISAYIFNLMQEYQKYFNLPYPKQSILIHSIKEEVEEQANNIRQKEIQNSPYQSDKIQEIVSHIDSIRKELKGSL